MTRPRNIAASVRARLTERARANKENVQLLLTRYAIERLLYRLGRSEHRERFILKGAMLFSLWADVPYRATGDLDLLGFGGSEAAAVARAFRSICESEAPEDGAHFAIDTIRAEPAREEDEYQGVRVTLDAVIAGARLPIQVDIGFGDVVTPAAQEIDYPPLLEFPAPRLRAYPPETVIAEKFQALVALGMLNSRMKDFYDLWAIAQTFRFDGPILAEAIRATFERRATAVPIEVPVALTPAFAEDPLKQSQWQGFLRRTAISMPPAPLSATLRAIEKFVMPPARSVAQQTGFNRGWPPGGPWSGTRDGARTAASGRDNL